MKNTIKISGTLLGVILVISIIVSSCKEDDDNGNGGKIDPNTIATANLTAHFPFDGNATERTASINPDVNQGVTWVAGRRGQAYQGADGARLLYTLPANSKLKTLTSFSLAFWLKSPLVTGDPEQTIFEIGKSDDLFWGNLKIGLLRLPATADSLNLKIFFLKTGAEWSGQHIGFGKDIFLINTWMHLVYTYDQATSKFYIYKDGVKVETNEGVEDRWAAPPETNPRPPLGPLAFSNADKINFGAWRIKSESTGNDPWMGWFLGNVDEFRVYDKALTATEVKDLYDAEVTQINP
jgi:hypothetical protein